MSSDVLIKLRLLYQGAATLSRCWSTRNTRIFSENILFKTASFWYIFQKESVVSSLYGKGAV